MTENDNDLIRRLFRQSNNRSTGLIKVKRYKKRNSLFGKFQALKMLSATRKVKVKGEEIKENERVTK